MEYTIKTYLFGSQLYCSIICVRLSRVMSASVDCWIAVPQRNSARDTIYKNIALCTSHKVYKQLAALATRSFFVFSSFARKNDESRSVAETTDWTGDKIGICVLCTQTMTILVLEFQKSGAPLIQLKFPETAFPPVGPRAPVNEKSLGPSSCLRLQGLLSWFMLLKRYKGRHDTKVWVGHKVVKSFVSVTKVGTTLQTLEFIWKTYLTAFTHRNLSNPAIYLQVTIRSMISRSRPPSGYPSWPLHRAAKIGPPTQEQP